MQRSTETLLHLMTQTSSKNTFGRTLGASRYEPQGLDLSEANNSRVMMIELVGRDKHVLEVGTSTGYMSRVLKQRGNTVVGVEIDPEAATVAKQYCDRFLNDDIESLLARDAFQESSFDAVILGDVLEHLKWQDGSRTTIPAFWTLRI